MSDRQALSREQLIALLRSHRNYTQSPTNKLTPGEYWDAMDEAAAALEQGTQRERNECNECGLVGRHDNACEGAPSVQFAMAMLPASAQDVCVQLAQRYFADSKSIVALVDLFAAAWCSGRDWSSDAAPPLPRDEDARDLDRACSNATARVEAIKARQRARDEDARRYRWLRENDLWRCDPPGWSARTWGPAREELDAAIDAALAEQERGGKHGG